LLPPRSSATVVKDSKPAFVTLEVGRLQLAFDPELAPGSVDDDGHMNFLERGLLKVVAAEQLLGSVVPPQADDSVPATKLKLGSGVVIGGDGALYARRAGVVLYQPGQVLDVVAQHIHQGPVDLRTGHLDMPGSLTVKGDIERLLQARASGDLEVMGSVSGSLYAGGSVRVSGSVRGGDSGRVLAEHDVTIRTCESAEVAALGVLRVRDAVNSQLQAQQVIVSGRLRGGSTIGERSVIVKEAGAPSGTATLLRAGEPVELPALEDVQRAVTMQKLRRMAERGGVRDAFGSRGDARAKGGKMGRLNAALSAQELQERARYAERRAQLVRTAVIELGLAHPGVELRIGAARLGFEQTVRGLRYALSPETGQLVAERKLG
jgi:hypothetical protein